MEELDPITYNLKLVKQYLMFSLLLVLCGCGHREVTVVDSVGAVNVPAKIPLSHNDSLRFKYYYLESLRQEERGEYSAAFDLLRHAMDINPQAAEVYARLAGYYGAIGQDSMVVRYFKKAAELSPLNPTHMERLAEVLIDEERFDDAIDTYERLYATNKDRSDVLNMLFRLYEHKSDYTNMLRTLDRIEAADGQSERLTLARMNVYEQQGRQQEALAVLQGLAQKHPYDMNYRVMMGNWLLQNGQKERALSEYEDVLAEEPDNTLAHLSLMDYYRADGQDSLATAIQEQMLRSERTPMDTKLTLMRQVVKDNEQNGGDSTQVLALFRRILQQPQQNSDMAELQAAYMSLKQMPRDTINRALEQVLSIAPDNAAARIQLLQNIWETRDFDRIIEQSRTALEYNPEEMAFFYFLGLAYTQQDRRDEALETFRKGTSVINEQSNRNLASDFYAIMGDILHEKGRADEAYAAYDSCLMYKDDNMMALNNYAYYLSEENRDLQKAEQMSYRTVKAEPDNSTYLDTYAWILFMQGRYAEARIYIDQAIENDSTQSGVLLEHCGDIYARNNLTDQAVEFWKRAQKKGRDSKVLARKIRQRRYEREARALR